MFLDDTFRERKIVHFYTSAREMILGRVSFSSERSEYTFTILFGQHSSILVANSRNDKSLYCAVAGKPLKFPINYLYQAIRLFCRLTQIFQIKMFRLIINLIRSPTEMLYKNHIMNDF